MGASKAIALVVVFVAVVLFATDAPPAQASHLCGNTGSPAGPFDLQTYEATDWRTTYSRTFELAGFNRLFSDVAGFPLPQLETGLRSAGSGQLIDPYIPPILLKAIAWIESSWMQADYSVPYGAVGPVLLSHDCGYGLMQVTTGMQNTTGVPNMEQAMIGGHYAFNIARGARILAEKWNYAPNYRPIVGNRDSTIIEDWYYAVWSYNGFTSKNHPQNSAYPLPRSPYRCDGTQPRSNYPYQELVFGCMANPPVVGGVRLWDPVPVTLPNLGVGTVQWGLPNDILVPGDYNGDGKTDLAVWRPSNGTWYVRGIATVPWGLPGDIPVPGDYNGDGKTDLAVWRPATGTWYVRGIATVQWGLPGDIPVPGDYNGDGKTDLAVWRPATGTWYVRQIATVQWGLPGDIPVPGDYNGDGKTDFAVWRPSNGTWYVRQIATVQWGLVGDVPVPGHYDGDGKTDLAVWRPSNGTWYVRDIAAVQWGLPDDVPVPGDYDGDGKTDLAVWRPSDGVWYTRSQPGFSLDSWDACSLNFDCEAMDMPTPNASHTDPANTSLTPSQVIGAPGLSVSPGSVTLAAFPGARSAVGSIKISNAGTGPLAWRLSSSVSWLKLSRTQGVSLGTDIGSEASTVTLYAEGLPPGVHIGQITIESLYASGVPKTISVTVGVSDDDPVPGDYDGDGKADLAVWRPSNGTWYVRGIATVQWGLPGDVPVPGDYDGDGKTDLAVWRPSTGTWYVRGIATVQWGLPGDVPVPGDYDGDGKTDLAVWRPSTGTWYVRGIATVQWGLLGDIPVPGDYDGDGKADLAVWRPSTGTWYVRGIATVQWGLPGDIPVPGDYDGDGKTDLAVWRPSNGTWYVRGIATVQWGLPGDIPVPGDYNGDGKTDLVVWRPSNGTWYIRGIATTPWGLPGDIPVLGS